MICPEMSSQSLTGRENVDFRCLPECQVAIIYHPVLICILMLGLGNPMILKRFLVKVSNSVVIKYHCLSC